MLKGVVTFITGGASGLGKATAERVIRQGGKAVICDLPNSDGANLANKLGENSLFCPADVTSEHDIENSLKVTKDKFGRLDVVVNNAGCFLIQKTYDFRKNSPHRMDMFNKIFAVNVSGAFNVIRLAVKVIAENKPNKDGYRGIIINTSSIGAFDGPTDVIAYLASKAAIAAMTLPLAREFASKGIRVCTIAPGFFKTPLNASIPESVLTAFKESTPHPKRFGDPDEFALLVQSIIQNPFLNGVTIRLDGAYCGSNLFDKKVELQ